MTDEVFSLRPLIAILLPWISPLVALTVPQGHQKLKKIIYVSVSFITFGVVLSFIPDVLGGKTLGISIIPLVGNIDIHLIVDKLGYFYGLTLTFIWFLVTIYSLNYIKHKEARFFSFMALCDSFILGCAFSQNMFTYFIFYELMTLSSYPLIVHEENALARRAGIKYLVYAIAAGAVIFFAVAAHYFWGGGDLTIVSFGTLSLKSAPRLALYLIFFTYLIGFGVKAAIMPFHGWVPDAHPVAPSPASAVLSAVILKAGAFGIIRVVLNVFGWDLLRELNLWFYLAVISSITIILASVFALCQDNLKKRLAYSSIGQVSYILLGLSLLSYSGTVGGIMHLAHHALMKSCLFLCAGTLLLLTGKRNISEMAGIGHRFPITMVCFSISALAMMGTPPSVGFISKWFLSVGALEANKPVFIVVLLTSALLNAMYFLPVIYTAFFKRMESEEHSSFKPKSEASFTLLAPVIILAALVIIGGVLVRIPGFPYSLVSGAIGFLIR